ncbi:hypothetical protein RYH73_22640 [Olivibacter sp. CPCC 100613]|uniref:hypothetical protein n=1 Tax=Olivibacter sp. CPCC 100613 TaxID=3079931 RepID=UPI002FFC7C3E
MIAIFGITMGYFISKTLYFNIVMLNIDSRINYFDNTMTYSATETPYFDTIILNFDSTINHFDRSIKHFDNTIIYFGNRLRYIDSQVSDFSLVGERIFLSDRQKPAFYSTNTPKLTADDR